MKILFFAPYIYDKNHREFEKNSSGFGYMVNDILKEVSKEHETYLITHQISNGYSDTYIALKHTWWDILKGIRLKNLISGLKLMFNASASMGNKLKYLYYYIGSKSIENSIEKIKPDVIHIHGLTLQTKPIIELCEKKKLKYIVTLHGLIGLDESTNASKADKMYEKEGLLFLENNRRQVTVVSSGVKQRIIEYYGLNGKNIKVILNGTSFNMKDNHFVDSNIINFMCIGTICKRKNQIQLVRCCSELPMNIKKRIKIHLIGKNSENINIEEEIEKRNLKDIVIYHGFIPREEIEKLWRTASFKKGYSMV